MGLRLVLALLWVQLKIFWIPPALMADEAAVSHPEIPY